MPSLGLIFAGLLNKGSLQLDCFCFSCASDLLRRAQHTFRVAQASGPPGVVLRLRAFGGHSRPPNEISTMLLRNVSGADFHCARDVRRAETRSEKFPHQCATSPVDFFRPSPMHAVELHGSLDHSSCRIAGTARMARRCGLLSFPSRAVVELLFVVVRYRSIHTSVLSCELNHHSFTNIRPLNALAVRWQSTWVIPVSRPAPFTGRSSRRVPQKLSWRRATSEVALRQSTRIPFEAGSAPPCRKIGKQALCQLGVRIERIAVTRSAGTSSLRSTEPKRRRRYPAGFPELGKRGSAGGCNRWSCRDLKRGSAFW